MGTRLVFTPTRTLGDDFTWNDTNMVVILLVESNLMIVSAACPTFRNLFNNVNTGFLVAETAHSSSKEGSRNQYGTGSYVLHTIGSGTRATSRRPGEPFSLGNKAKRHMTNVQADTKSDKSFGSQAIMVRRSVDVDAASVPEC